MTERKQLISGRWYVVDRCNGQTVAGPYDDKAAAEMERKQFNIADDCFSAQYTIAEKDPDEQRPNNTDMHAQCFGVSSHK